MKTEIKAIVVLVLALLVVTLIIQIITGYQEIKGRRLDNKMRKIDLERKGGMYGRSSSR